jgi:hypothetical protein
MTEACDRDIVIRHSSILEADARGNLLFEFIPQQRLCNRQGNRGSSPVKMTARLFGDDRHCRRLTGGR